MTFTESPGNVHDSVASEFDTDEMRQLSTLSEARLQVDAANTSQRQ